MKRYKRIMLFLFGLLMTFLCVPTNVFAAGNIDLNQEMQLNISYKDEDTPLIGTAFSIYLVATVDEHGELTTTETFDQFNVDIRGKNDDAWRTLASTLEGYVLRDQIVPTDSGITDKNGNLSFPTDGKKLTPGVYLVLANRLEQNGYSYDASPFMVMLPTIDMEENEWIYDVTADVKFESEKIAETTTRKVLKVWKDNGQEKERPEEIVVQLLQNGEVFDTVTLNQENNWQYTWAVLDGTAKWTIVEKEVENYTVEIAREGKTFVVTNTYASEKPTTPSKPGTNLPQTGQLWWPVPVLLALGLLCIVIGLIRRRSDEKEKK